MNESDRELDPKLFRPERLVRFRKDANLSKAKAAREAGIDAATWGRYEDGVMRPANMQRIDRLAKAIMVKPELLVMSQEEAANLYDLLSAAYGWPRQFSRIIIELPGLDFDDLKSLAQQHIREIDQRLEIIDSIYRKATDAAIAAVVQNFVGKSN